MKSSQETHILQKQHAPNHLQTIILCLLQRNIGTLWGPYENISAVLALCLPLCNNKCWFSNLKYLLILVNVWLVFKDRQRVGPCIWYTHTVNASDSQCFIQTECSRKQNACCVSKRWSCLPGLFCHSTEICFAIIRSIQFDQKEIHLWFFSCSFFYCDNVHVYYINWFHVDHNIQ